MQNAVKNLLTNDLNLEVGDTVQLQFHLADISPRHYVKVIGYHGDQSIMLSTPQINGRTLLVPEKQPVTVRVLSGRYIVAFKTCVLKSRTDPFAYLHLEYPNQTQSVNVRRAQRIKLKGEASVLPAFDDNSTLSINREVHLEDLSTSGALLMSDYRLGDVGDLLNVSIDLKFNISATDQTEQQLNLVAVIRNIRQRAAIHGNVSLYGVEFRFANPSEAIYLHAYVNENLVNSS